MGLHRHLTDPSALVCICDQCAVTEEHTITAEPLDWVIRPRDIFCLCPSCAEKFDEVATNRWRGFEKSVLDHLRKYDEQNASSDP